MTNKELIAKCKEYQKITAEIEERELKQKQIQAELKKATKGRTLFDTKAFAEKHPKLFKQFTKEGKPGTRFLFGLIKD